jgi:hypothetical protein
MTDKVTKPRQRRKKDATLPVQVRRDSSKEDELPSRKDSLPIAPPIVEETSSYQQQLVLSPRPNPPIKREPSPREEDAIAALRWQYKLPMLYQPSRAGIYDHAFVCHFVELNKGVRSPCPEIPWLTYLPGTYTGIKTPALKLSIRAASMAFYAKIHRDVSILVESYRWYTMSLNAQRLSLARFDGSSVPTDEDVLVPTILGLYEVYAGTAPGNVFQHLTAATKILDMRGPKNCRSGVASPLFLGIRVSDVWLMFPCGAILLTMIRPTKQLF